MKFFPCRIVSSISFVNSGLCSLLVLSTWDSVHLSGCLLGICPLAILTTWHSSHVGLFPLLALSTLDCAHFWFCLLGSPSTWDFIFFDTVLSEDRPHDVLLPKDCVHSWFCPICILLTFGSVVLKVWPSGCLVQLNSVYLRSLATWNSAYIGLCPLLILSTLGSAQECFFLLGSQSTWVFVYLDFVHLENCAHDILSIKDFVNDWLGPLWMLLPLCSFYLGLCLYFGVQDFFLLGSCPLCTLSTWFFLDFDSVYLGMCLHDILSM